MRLIQDYQDNEPVSFHNDRCSFIYHLIIMHPSEPCVLLFREDTDAILPFFEPGEHHFGVVGHINRLVRDTLGITSTVLRCASYGYDAAANRVDAVYILENHSHEWVPPENGIWADISAIQSLSFRIPEHMSIIIEWLRHGIENVPVNRRPWSMLGWFREARDWITNQSKESGVNEPVYIDQVRTWERSCILKATSDIRSFYFKAVPERLAHEIPVSILLADRFSHNTIKTIASDDRRHWLLMNEAQGTMLRQVQDASAWAEVLNVYARIQAGTVDFIDELLSKGCPDFTPAKMITYLEQLLEDPDAMLLGNPAGLSQEEYDTLWSLAPSVIELLKTIDEFNIPDTLVHGDFWAGNVIRSENDAIFFDWSDITISHPFFDLTFFFGIEEPPFPAQTCDALLSSYLKQWTAYEKMDRLKILYDYIQQLGWIHKALIEYRLILHGIEESARWEFQNTIPYYLRQAIRELTSDSI